MSKDSSRRVSTPTISNTVIEEPFNNFRSLRTHRSHNQIQRVPEVSVILEVDTDTESAEERISSTPNLKKNQSFSSSRPASINSSKFDFELNSECLSTTARDSRRSTKSVSTISTKSLNLTKSNRLGSSRSTGYLNNNGINLNRGLQNSNTNLNRSTSTIHSNTTAPVVREQYFCCRKWTKREKILTTVVVTLVLLVFGLVAAIGFIAEKRAEKIRAESFFLKL